MKIAPIDSFLKLVAAVNAQATARSEPDLSSKLATALEALGLHSVVDTGQASRKRPDILAYTNALHADLVMPAEVVVEAKKPAEVAGLPLCVAMAETFWADKTVPYISANLSRIQYFILTTYSAFAVLHIDSTLRRAFSRPTAELEADRALQSRVRLAVQSLSLADVGGPAGDAQASEWKEWLREHLHSSRLRAPKLSETRNTVPVRTANDLDVFATRLAALAAGRTPDGKSLRGVFAAVCKALPEAEAELDADIRRDLSIFAMAVSPYSTLDEVSERIKDNYIFWRDEFVAASIHSVVSRLFTLKVIEDVYCVGRRERLIESALWVVHSDEYDALDGEELRLRVRDRIQALKESKNGVVEQLAVFGAFYDWIWGLLDPVLFRTLFELYVASDFSQLEHDLLGRFFELYSQAANKGQRKALGQYYTPVPIVRYMWAVATRALPEGVSATALDPAMGSGTFLKEGARWMAQSSDNFWEHMVGFDVSPQVMGIAQANVYMGVLQQLDAAQALQVKRLRLFTTDSLDPRNGKYLAQIAPLFSDHVHRSFLQRTIEVSASIKRKEHFCIVIGNPPYKNNSAITLAEVARRFPRLLSTSVDAAAAQVRNIRDDYAWFFAAADHYVQDVGLICFITSDSYTHKASYRFFREELLRSYKIERIVNLGAAVFRDVSPRIGFTIILLRKRAKRLEPDPTSGELSLEEVPFYDLEPLVTGIDKDIVASESDPRLTYLDAAASDPRREMPPMLHRPAADRDYSLVPSDNSAGSVALLSGTPICAKDGSGVFKKKWPGIITAFDALLRSPDVSELQVRIGGLYALAQAYAKSPRQLDDRIVNWAAPLGLAAEIDRLVAIARQIADKRLTFRPERMKRSFAGSIPNDVRWYPPLKHRCVIYYEPELHIERNEHEGKVKGWGTMEQWRDPASHLISPKLIYTTSANPSYGYKAFLVDDEWYVKLHGGTSQQYNYTGLRDPSEPDSLSGVPNNVAAGGEQLLGEVARSCGANPHALLYFIAAIYNSDFANAFLRDQVGQELKLPTPTARQRRSVARIVELARELRDVHWLLSDLPRGDEVPTVVAERMASPDLLGSLGLRRRDVQSRGFKGRSVYGVPESIDGELLHRAEAAQKSLERLVRELYGR